MASGGSVVAAGGDGEAARLRALMPPPPPRRPPANALHMPGDAGLPKALLPEEDYAEGIAAIIERDYFPDIPKLRNQLEWARAVQTGDPAVIRQAQMNIARRRAGLVTPQVQPGKQGLATPGGWGATPGATALLRTPALSPLPPGAQPPPGIAPAATPAASSLGGAATPAPFSTPAQAATPGPANPATPAQPPVEELRAPPMSLDTFLATHTSEDNASFARIHAKDASRKRARASHLLVDANKPLLLEGPQQEGTPSGEQQPWRLVHTRHNPTNALYYVPDQKPLTSDETEARAARPAKQINVAGTRLKPAALPDTALAPSPGMAPQGSGPQAAAGAAGPDGAAAEPQRGPPELAEGRDWGRLSTPALTPGALGASPFMTWGDIASTPLRLDAEAAALGLHASAGPGPAFEVPELSRREQAAHELAAVKSLRELKRRQREAREGAAAGGMGQASTPARGLTPGRPWSFGGVPAARAGLPGGATPGLTPQRGAPAGLAGMSEAAQRLAKQLKAQAARVGTGGRTPTGGGDLDRQLRASYSSAAAAGSRTPLVGAGVGQRGPTPLQPAPRESASRPAPAAPQQQLPPPQQPAVGRSITDDLLHI